MNRAVVIQTTFGLASWLSKLPDGAKRGVVVGFDGRRMSRENGRDTTGFDGAAERAVRARGSRAAPARP